MDMLEDRSQPIMVYKRVVQQTELPVFLLPVHNASTPQLQPALEELPVATSDSS